MKERAVMSRLVLHTVACAAMLLPLAGCGKKEEASRPGQGEEPNVWKAKYENLVTESEKSYQRLAELEKQNELLRQQVESLRDDLEKAVAQKTPTEQVAELKKQLAECGTTVAQLNARVAGLKDQLDKAQRLADATEAGKELAAAEEMVRNARPRLEAAGKQAFDAGQYGTAREALTGVVELGGASARVLFQLGFSCAELGDNTGVGDWYGKAAEAAQKDKDAAELLPRIHSNRGATLVALGKPDEALKAYQMALEANADYAPVHFNLARLYAEQLKDPAKATEHYRRHIALGGSRSAAALDAIKKLQAEETTMPKPGEAR